MVDFLTLSIEDINVVMLPFFRFTRFCKYHMFDPWFMLCNTQLCPVLFHVYLSTPSCALYS